MKRIVIGSVILILSISTTFAQYSGLPLADNIAPDEAGTFGMNVMFTNLKDADGAMAVRGKYTILSGLKVFADLGFIGLDDLAIQSGLLYTLPIGMPLNIGLRGTYGISLGDWDGYSYSVAAVFGYTIPNLAWLSVYSQLGIASYDFDDIGDDSGFIGSVGSMFNYDEDISFFVEVGSNEAMQLDRDTYMSFGMGLNF